MPILDPIHDLAHRVEADQAWSESYYFNCYDPATDTGFFTRIGVRPNEGTIDSHLGLWLPGGDIAHLRHVREQTTMVDRHLESGPVTYDLVEPMAEWRIKANGPALLQRLDGSGEVGHTEVALDVRFRALTPGIGVAGTAGDTTDDTTDDTVAKTGDETAGNPDDAPDVDRGGAPDGSAEAATTVAKGHLEQAGRWSGWIEVDGTRSDLVDARGNRDKSWGPRDWSGPTMWRWFSINVGGDELGEGVHLGGVRLGSKDADLNRGWVWRDGLHASIQEWTIRTEVADDGFTQKVIHLTASDKADRTTHLRGEVLRVAPLPRPGEGMLTLLNEGLTRWSLLEGPEGEVVAVGHGIAEYLHQIGDDGTPLVPVQ